MAVGAAPVSTFIEPKDMAGGGGTTCVLAVIGPVSILFESVDSAGEVCFIISVIMDDALAVLETISAPVSTVFGSLVRVSVVVVANITVAASAAAVEAVLIVLVEVVIEVEMTPFFTAVDFTDDTVKGVLVFVAAPKFNVDFPLTAVVLVALV